MEIMGNDAHFPDRPFLSAGKHVANSISGWLLVSSGASLPYLLYCQ